jgi:hypothetical protein
VVGVVTIARINVASGRCDDPASVAVGKRHRM